jgi:hypothetical protein
MVQLLAAGNGAIRLLTCLRRNSGTWPDSSGFADSPRNSRSNCLTRSLARCSALSFRPFAHGKSCLSGPELLAASDRSRLNVGSSGYWSALVMPNSPELSRNVRVAKS